MAVKVDFSDNRHVLIKTLMIFLSYMGYAASIVIPGPALLDLQIRIRRSLSVTSSLISIHSVGYLLGDLIVGAFEQNLNYLFALFASNMVSGIFVSLAPWMSDYVWMASCLFIAGLAQSIIELVCHVYLVELWGEKVGPYIQILHMNYGIGALLAPIIVRPFLLPQTGEKDHETYFPKDVRVQWAFLMTGGLSIAIGVVFLFLFFSSRKPNRMRTDSTTSSDLTHPELSSLRIYVAVLFVAIITHVGFAIETIVDCFAQTFGVKSLKMDKKSAALLTTVFWASYTVSRVFFVVLSIKVGEEVMANLSILIMALGNVLNILWSETTEAFLWVSTALLGLGFSPLFAVVYSSLEKYFHLNGRQTSIIFFAGMLADSIYPPVIGNIVENKPEFYTYYMASLSILFLILMLILPALCKRLFGLAKSSVSNQHLKDDE